MWIKLEESWKFLVSFQMVIAMQKYIQMLQIPLQSRELS